MGLFSLKEGKSNFCLPLLKRSITEKTEPDSYRCTEKGQEAVVKSCNKEIPTGCNGNILHKASHTAPGQGPSEVVGSPSLETSRTGYSPEQPDPVLRLALLQTGHWIRWPKFFLSLCDLRKNKPNFLTRFFSLVLFAKSYGLPEAPL